jgi:diketogulonate reductase-like aldo/keto reductase
MGTFGHEEKIPTVKEAVPTIKASGTDDLDGYGQIIRLFQQIAQRIGHSVNSLILEWALCHAHTNMVKRRADGHMSNAMIARQQAFEEEVNKVIKLVGDFFCSTSFIINYSFSEYWTC